MDRRNNEKIAVILWHWCGFRRLFSPGGAPVLEFVEANPDKGEKSPRTRLTPIDVFAFSNRTY